MPPRLAILLPVYNDTTSLNKVLLDIQHTLGDHKDLSICIVDDGSTEHGLTSEMADIPVTTIHLARNLGHQKAIAIGLSYIKEHIRPGTLIVMDSDGEDRVSDIARLMQEQKNQPEKIVFASRKKRNNGPWFNTWYQLYKLAFNILTGKKISFGNFACLPGTALDKLAYYPELWNNFPGTVIKSGLPYKTIPLDRGQRYDGQSKMHFTSLLLHGFGAIAVFIERIITRITIASFLLMLMAVLAIAGIAVIRFTTDLAIPGWASTLGSSMLIVLLVSFIISLMTVFIYLSAQSQQKFIPAIHYKDYIQRIEKPGKHE